LDPSERLVRGTSAVFFGVMLLHLEISFIYSASHVDFLLCLFEGINDLFACPQTKRLYSRESNGSLFM
jgi:hypothetical protein